MNVWWAGAKSPGAAAVGYLAGGSINHFVLRNRQTVAYKLNNPEWNKGLSPIIYPLAPAYAPGVLANMVSSGYQEMTQSRLDN